MTMLRFIVDIVPGAKYRFAGLMGPLNEKTGKQRWHAPPAVYQCVGCFLDPHTNQDHIAYIGVGGRDDGNGYMVTLEEWQRLFTRIEEKQEEPIHLGGAGMMPVEATNGVPPEMPRKVAGYISQGTGV
jgi:hypothetical protein